jgi:hypothetical protein
MNIGIDAEMLVNPLTHSNNYSKNVSCICEGESVNRSQMDIKSKTFDI